MLLNNDWVNNEIKEEIITFLETNENQHITTQNVWHTKGRPEREVNSITGLPKEDRKNSKKQPNPTTKKTRGTTTTKKPTTSRRKEGIKIRAE